MFWLALILVVVVVVGNALILLRTARKPDIPDSFKAKPYQEDDGNGW